MRSKKQLYKKYKRSKKRLKFLKKRGGAHGAASYSNGTEIKKGQLVKVSGGIYNGQTGTIGSVTAKRATLLIGKTITGGLNLVKLSRVDTNQNRPAVTEAAEESGPDETGQAGPAEESVATETWPDTKLPILTPDQEKISEELDTLFFVFQKDLSKLNTLITNMKEFLQKLNINESVLTNKLPIISNETSKQLEGEYSELTEDLQKEIGMYFEGLKKWLIYTSIPILASEEEREDPNGFTIFVTPLGAGAGAGKGAGAPAAVEIYKLTNPSRLVINEVITPILNA
jgi:hypothetical protein